MRRFYVALTFIAFWSCQNESLSPKELMHYLSDEENGLKQTLTFGDTKIGLVYRPTDLFVLQDLGSSPIHRDQIEGKRKKYGQYLYFVLSLSNDNKEALHQLDNAQFSDVVQTLSFRMGAAALMTTSRNDTIPVADYQLNRTFGMASSTEILFAFNDEAFANCDWVQFNLKEIGLGIGDQRFRFEMKNIHQAPKIDFTANNTTGSF